MYTNDAHLGHQYFLKIALIKQMRRINRSFHAVTGCQHIEPDVLSINNADLESKYIAGSFVPGLQGCFYPLDISQANSVSNVANTAPLTHSTNNNTTSTC